MWLVFFVLYDIFLPRMQWEVTQIRGLKTLSRREKEEGTREWKECVLFCFAEPIVAAEETSTRCFIWSPLARYASPNSPLHKPVWARLEIRTCAEALLSCPEVTLVYRNTKISSYGQSFLPFFEHMMYTLVCWHARHVQLNHKLSVKSLPRFLTHWIKASCTYPTRRRCFESISLSPSL